MTTTTYYRLYRSGDGGTTWERHSQLRRKSVAREWYEQYMRWWLPNDSQRRLNLVRVTVTETEEIVASTEAAV